MIQSTTRQDNLKRLYKLLEFDQTEGMITNFVDQLVQIGSAMVPELPKEKLQELCSTGVEAAKEANKKFVVTSLAAFNDSELGALVSYLTHPGAKIMRSLEGDMKVRAGELNDILVDKVQKPALALIEAELQKLTGECPDDLQGIINAGTVISDG